SVPCTHGGTAIAASTEKVTSTSGPSFLPLIRSCDDVWTALPSKVIVQVSNGSMQRNPSPPAPSTVGRPSGPTTGPLQTLSRNRNTPPSGKARLTWTWCAAQFAATASIPMRGSPTAPRSSTTQKLTESRISGSSGFWANTCSRAGSMPPVKSIATQTPCDVIGEQRPNVVEIDTERHRVGVRAGLALGGSLGPPGKHPRFEFVADRLSQPRVQPADLMDRIGLHRAKVDVVEAFIGLAVAETQRSLHAV